MFKVRYGDTKKICSAKHIRIAMPPYKPKPDNAKSFAGAPTRKPNASVGDVIRIEDLPVLPSAQ